MELTIAEVEHIAKLARLDLIDDEKARYAEQLSSILEYAQRLQGLDTSSIPATASVLASTNVMREDEIEGPMSREDLLANAPAKESDQFRVDSVLE